MSTPAWDSPNSSSCSAKWAWDRPEGECHRPVLDLRDRRLKERANSGAHKTLVQAQSPEFKDGSVAPRPPAGPMPILMSAYWNLENPRPGLKSLAWDYRPRSLAWDRNAMGHMFGNVQEARDSICLGPARLIECAQPALIVRTPPGWFLC